MYNSNIQINIHTDIPGLSQSEWIVYPVSTEHQN